MLCLRGTLTSTQSLGGVIPHPNHAILDIPTHPVSTYCIFPLVPGKGGGLGGFCKQGIFFVHSLCAFFNDWIV